MRKSDLKATNVACMLAMGLWSIHALIFALRLMRYAGVITFNVYMGIDIAPIKWYEDQEAQLAQWIELVGYIATTIAVLYLTLRLIITTRRGLAASQLFTRSNARLLMWLAGIVFFNIFFTDNIGIIYGSKQVLIRSAAFVSSFAILIAAMLYRIAVSVAEENDLTI